MILIISEERDYSTNEVIDWLLLMKAPFLRINEMDIVEIKEVVINSKQNDILFTINNSNTIYSISQFKSYWYRRGGVKFTNIENKCLTNLSKQINLYLNNEGHSLWYFFISQIEICISVIYHNPVMLAITSLSKSCSPK